MLTGTLKRLIIMLALVGFVRTEPDRAGAARAGASSARGGADSAAVSPQPARRHRLPVEEGCRVPPPAPQTPPPPATCS